MADSMTVRDMSGGSYTFIKLGPDVYFSEGEDTDPAKRRRIERFTSPRGFLRMFLRGLMNRGEFKFVDSTGLEWKVNATAEALSEFMAWMTAPRPVRDTLPDGLKVQLEEVESTNGEFDLLLPARVAPVEGQADLGRSNVALVALSEEKALLVTESADSAPKLPEAVTRASVSGMSLVLVSEMSREEVSSVTRAYARGMKLRTRGANTVCCLRTGDGGEVFLQMAVQDIEAARGRLGKAA